MNMKVIDLGQKVEEIKEKKAQEVAIEIDSIIAEYERNEKKLAKYKKRNEEIASLLAKHFNHVHASEKTYCHNTNKITVAIRANYSINKAEYINNDYVKSLGIIKESTKYDVSVSSYKSFLKLATEEDKLKVSEVITVKHSLPSVKISKNT